MTGRVTNIQCIVCNSCRVGHYLKEYLNIHYAAIICLRYIIHVKLKQTTKYSLYNNQKLSSYNTININIKFNILLFNLYNKIYFWKLTSICNLIHLHEIHIYFFSFRPLLSKKQNTKWNTCTLVKWTLIVIFLGIFFAGVWLTISDNEYQIVSKKPKVPI